MRSPQQLLTRWRAVTRQLRRCLRAASRNPRVSAYARLRLHIELPRVRTQQVGYTPGQMEGIGYQRAIVQRQGRAKLTSDLSDHHGLTWRLGAIKRRQAGKRIVVLGRVAPQCQRLLEGSQLGRQTGAPLTPCPRGWTCFRGSSGFRRPSRDGSVSVEIVRASPGEQHVQIWMTHEPRIGPCGIRRRRDSADVLNDRSVRLMAGVHIDGAVRLIVIRDMART